MNFRPILIAAVVLLCVSACGSSGTAKTTSPSSDAPTVTQIPRPDAAQATALVRQLDKIAPGLGSEPADSVDNARNVCDSILGGAQNLVASTRTRFAGDGVDALSTAQAEGIVALVRSAAWCK